MERKKIIGAIDIGFGWTKAMAGGQIWKQPSIVGKTRQLFENDLDKEDVLYKKGNDEYFVGNLALRHSRVRYAGTAENKAETWTTKILLEAGLGIVTPWNDIYLVTGLPVDYYFSQKESFGTILDNFNDDDGYKLKIGYDLRLVKPNIVKHKIVPQPFGAAMNYVLDDFGQLINTDAAKRKMLVVDIGYYTLDQLPIEGMQIGKNACSPEGLGIDTAYKLIQDTLKEKLGKAPNRYDLDACVLAGEYEGLNIDPITDMAFESLAAQIDMEISALNTSFYRYIVTGGWSHKIAPYLNIPKEKTIIYNGDGNVLGYKKIGVRAWGKEIKEI